MADDNILTRSLSPSLFSSGKDDWETPKRLFDASDRVFHFTLDVAANPTNHKCARWFGPGGLADDALTQDWRGEICWLNPPYSRDLQPKFLSKAAASARAGAIVVVLAPARTDTAAFHVHVWDARARAPQPWVRDVQFLRGRVRFVGARSSAPFPSMLVVMGPAPVGSGDGDHV